MNLPGHHMIAEAPTPVAPFSHAVDAGGWVFLSGQIAQDPQDPDAPLTPDVGDQTHQCMVNLETVLNGLSLTWANVLSVRVFLTHFYDDYEAMNNAYRTYFAANQRPVRTCIGVTGLAREARVEIDLIASRG